MIAVEKPMTLKFHHAIISLLVFSLFVLQEFAAQKEPGLPYVLHKFPSITKLPRLRIPSQLWEFPYSALSD